MERTITFTEKEIEHIRSIAIRQAGYGFDGCSVCGKKWMRRPNTELKEHKDCMASPISTLTNQEGSM